MPSNDDTRIRCEGCGALVPPIDGPTHRYLGASPGCWALYGEVLAREYIGVQYSQRHQLTVDTYAAQHPGTPSPQSVQSVNVHLMSICAVLEFGHAPQQAMKLIQRAIAHSMDFSWLEPPKSMGAITIVDVHAAKNPEAHEKIVREWAQSVWNAWGQHPETVRASVRILESSEGLSANC